VYEGITADDVRQAAATVLRPANRTVGVLEPKAPAGAASPSGATR
jgi:predicted Zn-dependent peptidase